MALVEQALGGEGEDGVGGAGADGERDAGPADVAGAAAAGDSATPRQASVVAANQLRWGTVRSTSQPPRPASAGADPSATTVPTATPVSLTAAKKHSW
jgi:hypothetical protein